MPTYTATIEKDGNEYEVDFDYDGKGTPSPDAVRAAFAAWEPPKQDTKPETKMGQLVKSAGINLSDENAIDPVKVIQNIMPSTGKAISSMAEVITSPIQTAKGIGKIAQGALSNLGIGNNEEAESVLSAVWQEMKRPYGSYEAFKETIENDPARVLMDASTVMSGGAAALSKMPATAGFAKSLKTVANTIDPLQAAGKTVVAGVKSLKKPVVAIEGMLTGKGSRPLEIALKGDDTFKAALRGEVSGERIAEGMRDALKTIKDKASAKYRGEMAKLPEYFNAPRDMAPLKNSLYKNIERFGFKVVDGVDDSGAPVKTVTASPSKLKIPTNAALQGKAQALVDWFENPQNNNLMALDDLKKQTFDMFGDVEKGSTPAAFLSATSTDVSNFIKRSDTSGKYAEIMRDYGKSAQLLDEAGKVFSAGLKSGNKPALDTTMRKMITAMREDQDFRRTLITQVEEASGIKNIESALAGYLMNPLPPGGIIGKGVASGAVLVGLTNGLGSIHPMTPIVLAMSSPRVVGEFLNGLGVLGKNAKSARVAEAGQRYKNFLRKTTDTRTMYQAGKYGNIQEEQ